VENMSHEWEIAIQETVGKDRQITLPASVRKAVEGENLAKQPSVFWNYEQNAHFVVLSQNQLTKDNYLGAGYTRVYRPNESSERRKIRPPKELNQVLPGTFIEGTPVFYLAYREMTESENATVYLLTGEQLRSLLPQTETAGQDGLTDAVLTAPGFLRSV
jgi:hypothetical protein